MALGCGVLLCQVGACRLAVAARDVVAIEAPRGLRGEALHALVAFGAQGTPRRLLVTLEGEMVGVDGVELEAEGGALLAAPPGLAGLAGGSVRGFVEVRGQLWPLVALVPFGRYLREKASAAP